MKRLTCFVLLTALVLNPTSAEAQRRGELVEGLLRGFLEIQLEKDRRKALERERIRDRQRQRAAQPAKNSKVPVAVNNYRTQLGAFASESTALAQSMQRSVGKVRGVRPLLSQAVTLRTRAQLMHQRSRKFRDFALLRDEYAKLDFQWRELSFQLKRLSGFDRETLGRIRTLDGYCEKLCSQLELQPQFDRRAVVRLTIETTTHLSTLLEDVELELSHLPACTELTRGCRGLTEQCRQLSDACMDASYESLSEKYSTFVADWRKYAPKLYAIQNAHCERSIRRIHACHQKVFEQLRRPLAVDRVYLRYVSHALTERVNAIFENMTVKTLVQLPEAEQATVLKLARALYGHCQKYCRHIDDNSPLPVLVASYTLIDNQWPNLDRHLKLIKSNSVVTSRRLVKAYELELRHLLNIPDRLDRAHAVQLAASIETSAQHLRYDVRRFARHYNTAAFRVRAFQSSDAFYARAKQVHSLLQQDAGLAQIQTATNNLVRSWRSFSQVVTSMRKNGLSQRRYEYIDEARQEVVPAITELATQLSN